MRDLFLCFLFADWYKGYLVKHKMLQVRLLCFPWGPYWVSLHEQLPPTVVPRKLVPLVPAVTCALPPLCLDTHWAATPALFHVFFKAGLPSSLLPETFPMCQSHLISPFLESPSCNCAFFKFEMYLLLPSFRAVRDIHHFFTYVSDKTEKRQSQSLNSGGHLLQPHIIPPWIPRQHAPALLVSVSLVVSSTVASCPQHAYWLNL